MTEEQKNAEATKKLHEAAMALIFAFALVLLIVVCGHWVSTEEAMSFARWLNHAEAMVIAATIFVAAAAFQPKGSYLQQRITLLLQDFWRWC